MARQAHGGGPRRRLPAGLIATISIIIIITTKTTVLIITYISMLIRIITTVITITIMIIIITIIAIVLFLRIVSLGHTLLPPRPGEPEQGDESPPLSPERGEGIFPCRTRYP